MEINIFVKETLPNQSLNIKIYTMKKILLIIAVAATTSFLVLSNSSCKKKTYQCKCGLIQATIEAVSRSAADKACKDLGSSCELE